jgi:hydroxypyruvate reductase
VVGDRTDVIASGPTVGDESTFDDARSVLQKYALWQRAPRRIRQLLDRGAAGEIAETPKPADPAFARALHQVIGSNRVALEGCEQAARAAGWNTVVLSSTIEGETRDVARVLAAIGRESRSSDRPIAPPACIISGGETTVTLRGSGKGGRNQELALAAALAIAGEPGVAVLSAGTDGTDGPTDAAGAIAFGDTVERAAQAGLSAVDHLRDNDAYPLFDRIGDLIRTGPTGTNVMDVHLVLVDEPQTPTS